MKVDTHYLLSDTGSQWAQGAYSLLFSIALTIALVLIPERDPSDLPARPPTDINQHAPIEVRDLEDLSVRVLIRLEQAEKHELNPHLRDDLRIAWITLLFAHRGNAQPAVDATYRVLGMHPNKVWPAIEARRKSLLGIAYDRVYDAAGNLRPGGWQQWVAEGTPIAPKKPVRSVSAAGERRRRDQRAQEDGREAA